MKSELELQVENLRRQLDEVAERVRVDAVAAAWLPTARGAGDAESEAFGKLFLALSIEERKRVYDMVRE